MAPSLPKNRINVCVTGYGPFSSYEQNPSWLAVKSLDGLTLESQEIDIHITAFEIPVAYSSVLSIVPRLYASPPRLPGAQTQVPEDGFDLILHVGVGSPGGLAIERRARKYNYRWPDVNREMAPIIPPSPSFDEHNISHHSHPDRPPLSAAERREEALMSLLTSENINSDRRGFGEGYEEFDKEIWNTLDIEALLDHLHVHGFSDVRTSTDAGLFLCEFIYYCTLAESLRRTSRLEKEGRKDKATRALFVHVPPEGRPQTIREMTKAITEIITFTSQRLLHER